MIVAFILWSSSMHVRTCAFQDNRTVLALRD